jgi:hypothetical protein
VVVALVALEELLLVEQLAVMAAREQARILLGLRQHLQE